MLPDPDPAKMTKDWMKYYEKNNYQEGLVGYFLKKSHFWAEKPFNSEKRFSKVLELGAGTGIHLNYVQHQFDEYWITDLNKGLISLLKKKYRDESSRVFVKLEDATALSFPKRSFDRLIAAHLLEHLPNPHIILRKWVSVVKPGGLITIVLPCDPGLAWRMGRYAFARPRYQKVGFPYDYLMAREHINPINNLVSLIRYYFKNVDEKWLPFGIPSMDLNLFYVVNIQV